MANREQWLDLARRCEKARGPDREIDRAIFDLANPGEWRPRAPGARIKWCYSAKTGFVMLRSKRGYPALTYSLDAAVALIEKSMPDTALECHKMGSAACVILFRCDATGWHDPSYGRFSAEAVSLPLALCAAYCAARAGIEEGCAI